MYECMNIENQEEKKLCVNCKYFTSLYCCSHPNNLDLVWNNPRLSPKDLRYAYNDALFCGRRGLWFEPKPPELEKPKVKKSGFWEWFRPFIDNF